MVDNINVLPQGSTPVATDDLTATGYGHVQRVKLQAGGDGSAVDYQHAPSRQDTFTAEGSGTGYGVVLQGVKSFSISIKGTGGVPASWTVNLQVSHDAFNWTTILVHSNTGESPMVDGQLHSTGANFYPALYFRSNVSALDLGTATNIVVVICGMP